MSSLLVGKLALSLALFLFISFFTMIAVVYNKTHIIKHLGKFNTEKYDDFVCGFSILVALIIAVAVFVLH